MPSGVIYYASPDLLPGQTLSFASGTLSLVGDYSVPTVDGSSSGSPKDTIGARDSYIEVMDAEQATAILLRTGEVFGAGQAGSYKNIQFAMERMQDGDTLEISPGSIWIPGNGDGTLYLEGSCLQVYKSGTIRNMSGRGRWRLAPQSTTAVPNNSGIVIREPSQCYSNVGDTVRNNPRKTIVIEGFDFNNWAEDSSAVRIRTDASVNGSWTTMHSSITLRNFKAGKINPYRSASGISGMCETMVLEDGHVYDCGNGTGSSSIGQDHNAYISARTMTIRGVRWARTWRPINGHLLKASAVDATVEGCAFDSGYSDGDNSHAIQMKAGGNFTIRGCLFIDSLNNTQSGRGPLLMCREHADDGVTPNFEWWAGLNGNSMLVEKNLFIGHYGRGIAYFFPSGHVDYMGPGSSASQIASVTIRDNIGMVTSTPTVLSPMSSAKWIINDPTAGAAWVARGNTELTYTKNETGFDDKALKLYTRFGGAPAANAGTVATQRFLWPHGYMARSDALQGLG